MAVDGFLTLSWSIITLDTSSPALPRCPPPCCSARQRSPDQRRTAARFPSLRLRRGPRISAFCGGTSMSSIPTEKPPAVAQSEAGLHQVVGEHARCLSGRTGGSDGVDQLGDFFFFSALCQVAKAQASWEDFATAGHDRRWFPPSPSGSNSPLLRLRPHSVQAHGDLACQLHLRGMP